MTWTKAKVAAVVGVGILLATGTTSVVVFRHAIEHRIVLASGKRAIANHVASPIDLTSMIANYGTPASGLAKETRFAAWRTVPWGFQVFDHVPLQIDGAIYLWGRTTRSN
jgi:hypothetical protein